MEAIPVLAGRSPTVAPPLRPRQEPKMSRIVVVEDNESMAFGLQRTLEAEGHAVAVVSDGAEALEAIARHAPELVILDVMLGATDGFDILRSLRADGGTVPVLLLTARAEEADKVHGFRLGADDYVTKPFGLSELIARVGALIRRTRHAVAARPGPSVAFADVTIDPEAGVVTRGGAPVHLTPREYELLLAFTERPGTVLTRLQLLREVWKHTAEVHTRTVDIHVAELRRKLEDDPANPRHFITVWKRGYRFDR